LNAGVGERLDDGLVRILDLHVLPDHRDAHARFDGRHALDHALPFVEVGLLGVDVQELHHDVVQPFAVKMERYVINGCHVARFDLIGALTGVAECDLARIRGGDFGSAARCRADADFEQSMTLCCVGLVAISLAALM
jgi:hypothetical protein